jgi:hypothetical protein
MPFESAMDRQSTIEKWVHLKKKVSIPQVVFRNPLRPIPNLSNCPSCPGARESISVAIPINPLEKNEQ